MFFFLINWKIVIESIEKRSIPNDVSKKGVSVDAVIIIPKIAMTKATVVEQ